MRSESERALELKQNPWADFTHMEEVMIKHLVSEPGHTAWLGASSVQPFFRGVRLPHE